MPDQADKLRELVREALVTNDADDAPGTCVAVLGSTPGVGATSVLLAVARELASLGQRVLAVDGNLTRPALATQLGLSAAAGLGDVLAGRRRLCEATAPASFGAALLGNATIVPDIEPAARQRFAAELRDARNRFDSVLIDLAADLSPWSDWLCRRTGAVLLVAAPAANDIRGAYAALKSLDNSTTVRLAFNRADDPRTADALAQRIGATARQFLDRNPLGDSPAVIPPLSDDALSVAEHRRACRLLAAELMAGRTSAFHRRQRSPSPTATRRTTLLAPSAAASVAPSEWLDRPW